MILFEAGRQGTKVQWLRVACATGFAVALLWALRLAIQMPGSGEPQAAKARVGLALFFAALAGVVSFGLTVYALCYVKSVEDEEPGILRVVTLGILRPRLERIGVGRIERTTYHEGNYRGVSAPWWTIRVRDRSLPLILVAQGIVSDPRRLRRALRPIP